VIRTQVIMTIKKFLNLDQFCSVTITLSFTYQGQLLMVEKASASRRVLRRY